MRIWGTIFGGRCRATSNITRSVGLLSRRPRVRLIAAGRVLNTFQTVSRCINAIWSGASRIWHIRCRNRFAYSTIPGKEWLRVSQYAPWRRAMVSWSNWRSITLMLGSGSAGALGLRVHALGVVDKSAPVASVGASVASSLLVDVGFSAMVAVTAFELARRVKSTPRCP